MMVTEPQIIKFSGNTKMPATIAKWFNEYNCKYDVNTPLRVAGFLSQVIHESGGFKYTREIATGNAYESRKDLGNIYPGDGVKFKGHGYIQITGRTNHAAVSLALFGDRQKLLDNPELLATPQYAMASAFWYWDSRSLNRYADIQFFETITKRINGGLNGFDDRIRIYNKICTDFNLPLYKRS